MPSTLGEIKCRRFALQAWSDSRRSYTQKVGLAHTSAICHSFEVILWAGVASSSIGGYAGTHRSVGSLRSGGMLVGP